MALPKIAAMNLIHRFFDAEEFFSSAAENGYEYAEFWTGAMHLYVDWCGYDSLEPIKRLAKTYGIKIIGICPEQNNPKPWNIAAKSEAGQARTLSYFKNVIAIAEELEAYQVMVTAGWAYLDEPLEEARARSAAMLRKIAAEAEEHNTTLVMEALQPCEARIVNTAADMKDMLELVEHPSLKACIDFGAMQAAGDTIDTYFDLMGADVAHVHFVDTKGSGDSLHTHLAWGDGERNMYDDLRALEQHGYMGVVSAETYDGLYYDNPQKADKQVMQEYLHACAQVGERSE